MSNYDMPENVTHTGATPGMTPTIVPGAIAPAEGPAPHDHEITLGGVRIKTADADAHDATASAVAGGPAPQDFGPSNERMAQMAPKLVNALRELVTQFRLEGRVARRHEIRRIRQARLFWQGLQYAWWNPQDMSWHLPTDGKGLAGATSEQSPRYQFVTNLYQAFGLSFIALISQDVPSTRFFPQSTLSDADISTAKAASEIAELIEENNRVQQLLTGVGFYLWTDGKLGGYVRYVADGQRFGWREELVLQERYVRVGNDMHVCPQCGHENEIDDGEAVAQGAPTISVGGPEDLRGPRIHDETTERPRGPIAEDATGAPSYNNFLSGAICEDCGAALSAADFRRAPTVPVPMSVSTRRVPNGQEVISIVGGLELNTPVWANEQHEFPYLQWQMEVHSAKLKAAFPHAANEISASAQVDPDDSDARTTRVAVAQGVPGTQPGDALFNLITFSRTWVRPWAFYAIEDIAVRDALLAQFPDGCYVAFAGDIYCESRSESMDDCWRVMHAMPGDGQNRPSVGESLIQVQERYNTLSNIQAETYEYGIPPIYADPQVLDFDALAGQTAEPAAHYPARARAGMALADGFFQPAPAQVPPDMLRHQQDLAGPIAQFLTGLFPAVFGGEMAGVKTASGYAMARDQALGRLGLVWRRLKQFYADVMLLSVDCFRKNRPADVEIPFLGAGGEFQARFIRLADLRGNIQTHAESDESFPRLKSQQRAVLQQLMGNPDPMVQATLREPANFGFIKSLIGLNELVVPGEEARTKQLREIQQLLNAAPIAVNCAVGQGASTLSGGGPEDFRQPGNQAEEEQQRGPVPDDGMGAPSYSSALGSDVRLISTVPVDDLLDDHATEFEECRRWASSDAGQLARTHNPAGFANVRAHAAEHAAALAHLQAATLSSLQSPSAPSKKPLIRANQAATPEFHTTSMPIGSSSRSNHYTKRVLLPDLIRLPDESTGFAMAEPATGTTAESGTTHPVLAPGGHWVTINHRHALLNESEGDEQGMQTPGVRSTPESLTALIPSQIREEMAKAIDDSNKPTVDDKKGGFHEESGLAGLDNSGNWVVQREMPGSYANPDTANKVEAVQPKYDPNAINPVADPKVYFHVHPSGTTETHNWNQPPSDADQKAVSTPGLINIVFAAREKKVYFYDRAGQIGKAMNLKDFLRR